MSAAAVVWFLTIHNFFDLDLASNSKIVARNQQLGESEPAPAAMARMKRAVLAAAEESVTPPDSLAPNQSLVRVVKAEGSNLYTCELPNKKTILLELAQRFRNTIWIRRGGFVLAERYQAGEEPSRAAGEIVNIVRDEKMWRKQPYWPKEFAKAALGDDEEDSVVGKMPPSDDDDD